MLKLRSNRDFTLIELLVVVIIVAVLAAVGVPLLSANVERARASEAEAVEAFGALSPRQVAPSRPGPAPTRASIKPPHTGDAGLATPYAESVPDVVHGGGASIPQDLSAAIQELFPQEEWNTAKHIAAAESNGDSNGPPGAAGEIGAFQIHPINWAG